MLTKLLPCRFCGGVPLISYHKDVDCGCLHFLHLAEFIRQNYQPSSIFNHWQARNAKNNPFIKEKDNAM